MGLFFLDDLAVKLLQSLLDEARSRKQSSPAKWPAEFGWADRQDFMSPEIYIARPQDAGGIPGLSRGTDNRDVPGKATCDLYRICGTEDTKTIEKMEDKSKPVFNLSEDAIEQDWLLAIRAKSGDWIAVPTAVGTLVGGCLAEDHPGRSACDTNADTGTAAGTGSANSTLFYIHLGTWNPDQNCWNYDMESTELAVDFRYGVPYPTAGATGLFKPRTSTEFGTIYEVVALDCDSPGECGGGY